jgi:hypothetical protein
MNIFVLHLLPRIAAIYHCDKHVVKMILESAQLLYSAHHISGNPFDLPNNAYKKTHVNHPCAIWVRESRENYKWLAQLGWWLCKEYQTRYGKHKNHKTEQHIRWLMANIPFGIPDVPATPFRQAMPDEYKHDDAVQAYRTYYIESKMKARRIVTYTKRPFPEFLRSPEECQNTNI